MPPRINEQRIRRETSPAETVDETQRTRRPITVSPATRPARAHGELRRTLASRRTLRQAILLNEILGPPKALRKPDD